MSLTSFYAAEMQSSDMSTCRSLDHSNCEWKHLSSQPCCFGIDEMQNDTPAADLGRKTVRRVHRRATRCVRFVRCVRLETELNMLQHDFSPPVNSYCNCSMAACHL